MTVARDCFKSSLYPRHQVADDTEMGLIELAQYDYKSNSYMCMKLVAHQRFVYRKTGPRY